MSRCWSQTCGDNYVIDNEEGLETEMISNALLIAAAPDLLEALRDVLKYGGESADEWIDMRYYRKAQLAIAKAEGRS